MAIAMYFHPASFTAAQYDETIARLAAAGAGSPAGRLHHSCFGPPDSLMVYDVWDSQESFDKFGETLMPIMAEMGIDAGQPDVMPVHNVIQ
jgi:hypothetical protein